MKGVVRMAERSILLVRSSSQQGLGNCQRYPAGPEEPGGAQNCSGTKEYRPALADDKHVRFSCFLHHGLHKHLCRCMVTVGGIIPLLWLQPLPRRHIHWVKREE